MYSYVIEVGDSESDLGLHDKTLVPEIFAFYHLLENALWRPESCDYVHLDHGFQNYLFIHSFECFENVECFEGCKGVEGFERFEGLRVLIVLRFLKFLF